MCGYAHGRRALVSGLARASASASPCATDMLPQRMQRRMRACYSAVTLVLLLACCCLAPSPALGAPVVDIGDYLSAHFGFPGPYTLAQLQPLLMQGPRLTISGKGLTLITAGGLDLLQPLSDALQISEIDFTYNNLTSIDWSCNWCPSEQIRRLELQYNALNKPNVDNIVHPSWTDSMSYLDLSSNPVVELSDGFGSSRFFTDGGGPRPTMPVFKCSHCQISRLACDALGNSNTDVIFARSYSHIDLSYNNFSDWTRLSWDYSFANTAFSITSRLDLSHSWLTYWAGDYMNVGVMPPSPLSPSPTIATVLDLSYSDFSAADGFYLAKRYTTPVTWQFPGTVIASHSGIPQVIASVQLNGGQVGNLDLGFNDLSAPGALNLAGFEIRFVSSGTGKLTLDSCGITALPAGVFSGLKVYELSLSGNAFPLSTSWDAAAWNGAHITSLVMNRCGMTAATLQSNGGNPFGNLADTTALSMANDAGDPDNADGTWNIFNPLPSAWLRTGPFTQLMSLKLGRVDSLPPGGGFFGSYTSAASVSSDTPVAVVLQLAAGTSPMSIPTGPVWLLITGYGLVDIQTRLSYTLELQGWDLQAGPMLDWFRPTEGDRLYPESISVPLEPAFLSPTLWDHFYPIQNIRIGAPSSPDSTVDATPWNAAVNDTSFPADLLHWAEGMVSFTMGFPLGTAPPPPISTLPASFFQYVRPDMGFGSLTHVDLSMALLTWYPIDLFAGLTRTGTAVAADLNMLWQGDVPIPVGLFDGIETVTEGSSPLVGGAKRNKVRGCAYLGTSEAYPLSPPQSCNLCPQGSFTQSVPKFGGLYCARCAAGFYCTDSATKPCPAGKFQPDPEASSCYNCAVGTYNNATGQAQSYACIACKAGTYNAQEGSTSEDACLPCEDGSVNGVPAAFECTPCDLGTYADTKRYTCVACPQGRYGNASDADVRSSVASCIDCDVGTTTTSAGATGPGQCVEIPCPPGMWYSKDPLPFTTPGTTAAHCRPCVAGQYCFANRNLYCPPGSWAPANSGSCTLCPPGTYTADSGSTRIEDCTACVPGTYSQMQGSAACSSCPAGTVNAAVGATDRSACLSCSSSNTTTNSSLCTKGAAEVITLTELLDAAPAFIAETSASGASRSSYSVLRGGPSLRLTSNPDDASLALAAAYNVSAGSSSVSHSSFDPTSDLIISNTMFALLLSLVIGSIIPLLLYRFIPIKKAHPLDVMAAAHRLKPGGLLVYRPTQFGVAFSLCFLCLATFTAIQLGSASNATMLNTLQPASANPNTGTAQAAMQITLKAYGAPAAGSSSPWALDTWCMSNTTKADSTGFTEGILSSRAAIQRSACVLAVDCLDCGMDGVGSVTLTLPYVAQLLEWEVWVTGAIPGSWSRFYGVVSQLPDQMLDAQATLQFSAIEAYFIDSRVTSSISYCKRPGASAHLSAETGVTCSLPDHSSGSGFEMAFSKYNQVAAQSADTITTNSKVALTFQFQKQDVVYQTTVAAKLSVFQILSSVLATVVSLLSVFMLLFGLTELVLRKVGWSSGPLDVSVHIRTKREIMVEEAAARRAALKSSAVAVFATAAATSGADAAATAEGHVPSKVTVDKIGDTAADSAPPAVNRQLSVDPAVAALLGAAALTGSGKGSGGDQEMKDLSGSRPAAAATAAMSQELQELKAALAAMQAQMALLAKQSGGGLSSTAGADFGVATVAVGSTAAAVASARSASIDPPSRYKILPSTTDDLADSADDEVVALSPTPAATEAGTGTGTAAAAAATSPGPALSSSSGGGSSLVSLGGGSTALFRRSTAVRPVGSWSGGGSGAGVEGVPTSAAGASSSAQSSSSHSSASRSRKLRSSPLPPAVHIPSDSPRRQQQDSEQPVAQLPGTMDADD